MNPNCSTPLVEWRPRAALAAVESAWSQIDPATRVGRRLHRKKGIDAKKPSSPRSELFSPANGRLPRLPSQRQRKASEGEVGLRLFDLFSYRERIMRNVPVEASMSPLRLLLSHQFCAAFPSGNCWDSIRDVSRCAAGRRARDALHCKHVISSPSAILRS